MIIFTGHAKISTRFFYTLPLTQSWEKSDLPQHYSQHVSVSNPFVYPWKGTWAFKKGSVTYCRCTSQLCKYQITWLSIVLVTSSHKMTHYTVIICGQQDLCWLLFVLQCRVPSSLWTLNHQHTGVKIYREIYNSNIWRTLESAEWHEQEFHYFSKVRVT